MNLIYYNNNKFKWIEGYEASSFNSVHVFIYLCLSHILRPSPFIPHIRIVLREIILIKMEFVEID